MTKPIPLETYEEKIQFQCVECGEIYNGDHCPDCGSLLATRFEDDNGELQELLF